MEQFFSKPHEACLVISRSIYDPSDLCPLQGPGAHRAWFKRDIKCASLEILAVEVLGCSSDGKDLGVCSHILEEFNAVV